MNELKKLGSLSQNKANYEITHPSLSFVLSDLVVGFKPCNKITERWTCLVIQFRGKLLKLLLVSNGCGLYIIAIRLNAVSNWGKFLVSPYKVWFSYVLHTCRGLVGYRSVFSSDTRGTGFMHRAFLSKHVSCIYFSSFISFFFVVAFCYLYNLTLSLGHRRVHSVRPW